MQRTSPRCEIAIYKNFRRDKLNTREFFFPLRAPCDNRIASGLCRQSLQATPNVVL